MFMYNFYYSKQERVTHGKYCNYLLSGTGNTESGNAIAEGISAAEVPQL
ncbi:MAG: hypothetical protein ACLSCV_08080 [Acutalibacteraceae bacterium]